MSNAPIIPAENNPNPAPNPQPHEGKQRTITCECCGSRLDRTGGLLKRGDLAREMLNAEDKIDELQKQLKKASDDLTAANQTISELRAAIPEKKRGFFDIEV